MRWRPRWPTTIPAKMCIRDRSTPENGAAQVAVAVRTGTMQMTLEELLVRLSRQRTVVEVHRGL